MRTKIQPPYGLVFKKENLHLTKIRPPYGLVLETGDLQIHRYPEQVVVKIKTGEGSVVVGLTDVAVIDELAKAINP